VYFAEVGRVDRDLFRQLIEAVQWDDQISAWLLPLLSGIGFNDHELPFLLELASSDAVATKDFVNLAYLDCLAGLSAASRLAFVKVLLRRHGGPQAVFCLLWRFWYGVNAENIISMDTDEIEAMSLTLLALDPFQAFTIEDNNFEYLCVLQSFAYTPNFSIFARKLAEWMKVCISSVQYFGELNHEKNLAKLIEIAPVIAFEQIIEPQANILALSRHYDEYHARPYAEAFAKTDLASLLSWATELPKTRFSTIAAFMPILEVQHNGEQKAPKIADCVFTLLAEAPDKALILKEMSVGLLLSGWSGSYSVAMASRRGLVIELIDHVDETISEWAKGFLGYLDERIEEREAIETHAERRSREAFEF
jgi:hypothetical protein